MLPLSEPFDINGQSLSHQIGIATELTDEAPGLQPIFCQSESLFPVRALPLEVVVDVRCSRIHLLKETAIKILQTLRVQIGINTHGAARRTHYEIQRQPIAVNLCNNAPRRIATWTSRAFKLVDSGLKPGSDLGYERKLRGLKILWLQ